MNRGFTLLELLIVLALSTGLGLIALPLPVQHRDRLVLQQAMRRLRLGRSACVWGRVACAQGARRVRPEDASRACGDASLASGEAKGVSPDRGGVSLDRRSVRPSGAVLAQVQGVSPKSVEHRGVYIHMCHVFKHVYNIVCVHAHKYVCAL